MKIRITLIILLIIFSVGNYNAYCQESDTIYYAKNKIRSIEVKRNGTKVLTMFKSKTGKDLLSQKTFSYSYFDNTLISKRIVEIEDYIITRDYWINNQDTIFNIGKFNENELMKFEKSFNDNVGRYLKYPKEAHSKGLEGRVLISFIVNKNGAITDIKAITKIGFGFEEAAIIALEKYKNWGIIRENGKPVNYFIRLPISFRLE